MKINAGNSSMPTGSITELLKWLESQVDEGRREKANDPNLSEAERMKYKTAIGATYGELRDNSGGTSESKGHVMPWNKK